VSDNGIKTLSSVLEKFRKMDTINLNFNNCHQITDESLCHLSRAFKENSLKNLCLKFAWCYLIHDKGMVDFSRGLVKLKSLEKLHIHLGNCRHVTDIGIENLCNALSDLHNLKSVALDIDSCDKLTDLALQSLSHSFTKLTSLKNIALNFDRFFILSNKKIKIKLVASNYQIKELELSVMLSRGYPY